MRRESSREHAVDAQHVLVGIDEVAVLRRQHRARCSNDSTTFSRSEAVVVEPAGGGE